MKSIKKEKNMKLSDALITMILKKGFLYESRNCDMEIKIPMSAFDADTGAEPNDVIVKFKAEHMSLKIERSES